MRKPKTKIDKLLQAIAKRPLTAKQIKTQFGIPNPSAVIYDLRRRGFEVDLVGNSPVKYSL